MKISVIKIGGKVIADQDELTKVLQTLSQWKNPFILVHGGGTIASEIGQKLGIAPNMIDGRRITDDETIDLVTMVYGGLLNKKIVAQLQALNVNAIGLTGADGNLITAQKRPVSEHDYGWVGDVEKVNVDLIKSMLENRLCMVISALTHDGSGHMLNTNADTIATEIAIGISRETEYETELLLGFDQPGVMLDIDRSDSLLTTIDSKLYMELVQEKVIVEGMLPKLENCFRAVQHGVDHVVLGKASELDQLSQSASGTEVLA